MNMTNQQKTKFRLNGNKLLLTYHNSNGELSKKIIFEQVVDHLKSIEFKIIYYYLVEELNRNPNIQYYNDQAPGGHYHLYLEVEHETDKTRTLDIKGPLFFDINHNNKRLHGNYVTVSNVIKKNKENKFLTYDIDNLTISTKEIIKNSLKKQALTGSYKVLLYLLKQDRNPWSNLPTEFLLNLDELRKSLNPNEDKIVQPLHVKCKRYDFSETLIRPYL